MKSSPSGRALPNRLTRLFAVSTALVPALAGAAHPLITEDTGTQGRNHLQGELNSEQIHIDSNGQEQITTLVNAAVTWGALDNVDIVLTVPWLRLGADPSTGTPGTSGLADVGLDVKWRFYEDGPLSIAFKPGITLPTGDDTRGLGTGELSWSTYVVTAYEIRPVTLLLHLGHLHHNNTFNERADIWHGSAAVVYAAHEHWKLALDAGVDTHTDRTARSNPSFVIAGMMWSPRPDFDVDLGCKFSSSDTEHSRSLLAGITKRW